MTRASKALLASFFGYAALLIPLCLGFKPTWYVAIVWIYAGVLAIGWVVRVLGDELKWDRKKILLPAPPLYITVDYRTVIIAERKTKR